MADEYGTKDWDELLDEWRAAMATELPPRPTVECGDRNPWDRTIRCQLARGHREELHYRLLDGIDPQRWADACHWPGDSCGPCSNLRRSA